MIRKRWPELCLVATLLFAGAAAALAQQRTDSYGAIAYGPKSGASGDAYGESSAADAERKALSFCARRGDDCKVITSFSNTCAAVAVLGATGATFAATNAKRGAAEAQAMSACRQQPNSTSCRVPSSICAQR